MIDKTISHYKILEKLGEGGMGVVYKAEDTKLDRLVALKFLPSHLIDDEQALSRLLKEAKAASKINHPNVCTIYDIKEYEDTQYIVMEYVDGETVKNKIKNDPLSINETVEYSVQICKGLKAAHDKGITHRDIKSENIMINTDNMVKVMDFGLAKLKDEARLSRTSSTAGTIAYMAPEQIKGEDIDHRADIWAFGVVIFEMLTCKFPFQGEYESAMSYSIVNTDPEPIAEFRENIPFNLEQVIYKSLEKDLSSRYQSIQEVLSELKKIPSITAKEPEQEKSIVVLPFRNMSPDPDQEYFSDGLTEEIITDLSHIHDFLVISSTSAMILKGTKKDVKTIGRELNVQYVLEGSVRKAGNNLRITAQLIDATTDAHLWAEKYSGTLDDVFDIQEKVSRSIVDELKLKLTPKEDIQIAERPIDNVQAYECYLRARHEYWRFTAESAKRALQHLQEALEIVRDNVFIYAGMAEAYFVLSHTKGEEFVKHINKVEECAKKIFELEPESSYGYCFLGLVRWKEPKPQEGVRLLKRAFDINPNDTETLSWLGFCAAEFGKPSIAEPCIRKLIEIDPLSPMSQFCLGWFHLMAGRLDPVLEAFKKAYQMAPDSAIWGFKYARALALNQQFEEAYSIIDHIIKSSPEEVFAWLGPFYKYALQGDKIKALKSVTEDLKTASRLDETLSWYMAECYALIDEKEEAIDWLENAVWRGFLNYPLLSEYDPLLENIRGEERFKKLMERVKHEWENFEV